MLGKIVYFPSMCILSTAEIPEKTKTILSDNIQWKFQLVPPGSEFLLITFGMYIKKECGTLLFVYYNLCVTL